MENFNSQTVIIPLGVLCLVFLSLCIIMGVKLFQALRDNATLEHQSACITADNSQEMTFKDIDEDLQKIIKLLQAKSCNNCKIPKPHDK